MKRAKRHVARFIEYMFGHYKLPRIPVIVHWDCDVIETPAGVGFGVYMERTDGTERAIHIAGAIGKKCVIESIAHEIFHYMQHLNNLEYDSVAQMEADAEYWAMEIIKEYRRRK